MISPTQPLVLGSGSPRRRELLSQMRIPVRIVATSVDESTGEGELAHAYLNRVVDLKLCDVARRLSEQPEQSMGGVLVADTIVLVDGPAAGDQMQMLGKPNNVEQAREMIAMLSGRVHQVLTRFALALPDTPWQPCFSQTVQTNVWFRKLTEAEISGYAQSGEGLDKAGGYAAQGLGAFAVQRIEGSYPNVIGLPVCEVVQGMLKTGMLTRFPL